MLMVSNLQFRAGKLLRYVSQDSTQNMIICSLELVMISVTLQVGEMKSLVINVTCIIHALLAMFNIPAHAISVV